MGAAAGPVVGKAMVLATRCIWRGAVPALGSPGCQRKPSGFCQAQHRPVVWATAAEAGQAPEER